MSSFDYNKELENENKDKEKECTIESVDYTLFTAFIVLIVICVVIFIGNVVITGMGVNLLNRISNTLTTDTANTNSLHNSSWLVVLFILLSWFFPFPPIGWVGIIGMYFCTSCFNPIEITTTTTTTVTTAE